MVESFYVVYKNSFFYPYLVVLKHIAFLRVELCCLLAVKYIAQLR